LVFAFPSSPGKPQDYFGKSENAKQCYFSIPPNMFLTNPQSPSECCANAIQLQSRPAAYRLQAFHPAASNRTGYPTSSQQPISNQQSFSQNNSQQLNQVAGWNWLLVGSL
jgi:hypothetical protein